MDLDEMCQRLCNAERDRVTSAEICVDEVLTIMDRHGLNDSDPAYRALAAISGTLHRALTIADGFRLRGDRIRRVRDGLTQAFPLSDDDLGRDLGRHDW